MSRKVSIPSGFAVGAAIFLTLGFKPAVGGTGYADYDTLTDELRGLADAHPEACVLSAFGTSRQGRELWSLTLGRGADRADRLAMVIVAGIDGNNPATTATAVGVARALLSATEGEPGFALLANHTVHVLPRVNPDAMESYFADARYEQRVALRPWDDDRDGAVDEDGPEDINGDGLITMMRVSLQGRDVRELTATHLPDASEPRLLKKADPAEGEKAIYALLVEGIDSDGDGAYNEDGAGGVDLNRNFMHEYQEHEPSVGPHQVSEPESKALIDFFLEHPQIAIAIFYARHDNVVEVAGGDKSRADAKGRSVREGGEGGGGGRMSQRGRRGPEKAPTGLYEDDVSIYKEISERYREITGVRKVPTEPADGAAFAWAYSQYGIPSFACRIGTRPEPEPEPETASDGEPGQATNETDDAETPDEPRPPRRGGGNASGGRQKRSDADNEEAAWLKYSHEQRGGAGFVPWTPFAHPQLGDVEIGGFAPFFRIVPPPSDLQSIAEKQLAFLLDLGGRFPDVSLVTPQVTRLAETVYEIRTEIVNRGYFPSGLAIAEVNRRVRPIVVSLDVDLLRVLGGRRVEKIWSIPGSGGRHKLRWVVQGDPDSSVIIKFTSEKYGDTSVNIRLTPTNEDGEN